MAHLPCPRCGNDRTLGTFCKDCLREIRPLVVKAKPGHLTLCARCDNVKLTSDWKRMPQTDAVRRALSPGLQFGDATIKSVEFGDATIERKPGIRRMTDVLTVVTGAAEQGVKPYEEEYDVPLQYDVTLCPRCGRQGSTTFQGIMQIRNQTPAVQQAVRAYVRQHQHNVRLVKEVPVSTGSDYYLSDQRTVHHLAKQLHGQFGGELKISAQHFSYDSSTSKNLYRVNAYLEIPEYAKGDVIRKEDQYYYVLGVGVKVKAENLRTGSQESFPYQNGQATRLAVRTTQVTRSRPLEVLHPATFQSVRPTNSKYAPAELEPDDLVSVAVDGAYLFLIPRTEDKEERRTVRKRHSQKRKHKDDDLLEQ